MYFRESTFIDVLSRYHHESLHACVVSIPKSLHTHTFRLILRTSPGGLSMDSDQNTVLQYVVTTSFNSIGLAEDEHTHSPGPHTRPDNPSVDDSYSVRIPRVEGPAP